MKKILFILFLLVVWIHLKGQQRNKLALGLNANQYRNDFGIGAHVISPYFANNSVAIKVGYNFHWLQHIKDNNTVWSPYNNFQLGFRGRYPIIKDRIFIYEEGGTVLLLPKAKFSTESTVFGGYGLFGFDFLRMIG